LVVQEQQTVTLNFEPTHKDVKIKSGNSTVFSHNDRQVYILCSEASEDRSSFSVTFQPNLTLKTVARDYYVVTTINTTDGKSETFERTVNVEFPILKLLNRIGNQPEFEISGVGGEIFASVRVAITSDSQRDMVPSLTENTDGTFHFTFPIPKPGRYELLLTAVSVSGHQIRANYTLAVEIQ